MIFSSGASLSFMSQIFSRGFEMSLGELECSLRVSITNEHEIYASKVYQGCVLEIFGAPYSYPHGGCVCNSRDGLTGHVRCYDRL